MNDFEALGGVSTLLVILVIAIVIFLILREVVTWYWKINQRVGLLEDILAELRALRTGQPISKRLHCDQCGAETVEGDEFCPGCGSKVARSKNEKSDRDSDAFSYCPECKAEYREGFTVCSNCKVELMPYD